MRPRTLLSRGIFNKTFVEHWNWLAIALCSFHEKICLSLLMRVCCHYTLHSHLRFGIQWYYCCTCRVPLPNLSSVHVKKLCKQTPNQRPIFAMHICRVFTWKEHGRCYLLRFHCRFIASQMKFVETSFHRLLLFFWHHSENWVLKSCFFPFSIFEMYVNTPMMRNFGFEYWVHWPTRQPSFKIFSFEWKWILIGLRGFSDRFWQNNFCSKIATHYPFWMNDYR